MKAIPLISFAAIFDLFYPLYPALPAVWMVLRLLTTQSSCRQRIDMTAVARQRGDVVGYRVSQNRDFFLEHSRQTCRQMLLENLIISPLSIKDVGFSGNKYNLESKFSLLCPKLNNIWLVKFCLDHTKCHLVWFSLVWQKRNAFSLIQFGSKLNDLIYFSVD